MATVALTPVLIWYAPSPEGVVARVRTYAGEVAIDERVYGDPSTPNHTLMPEEELTELAQADGRSVWDERDIIKHLGIPDLVWAGSDEGRALYKDIAPQIVARTRKQQEEDRRQQEEEARRLEEEAAAQAESNTPEE